MDEYERTLNALQHYRVLADEDDGAILPETAEPVEAGDYYEGAQRLISILTRVGDLPAGASFDDPDLYAGALVTAVQRFQLRHGLEPSGRIDKATLKQLNTPLKYRVHQLELALEQWRRNPYDPAHPAIVVNLPEFRLRAYSANHLDLEMKIVVGKADGWQTPVLSSTLEAIVFRPYWNVPFRIQREELVPAIVKDDEYLAAHYLEIVDEQGDVVPGGLSANKLAQLRSGTLRLRQTPGPWNSLGLLKFVFPNSYHVYLHDTPVRSVFWRSRRDLSHACIRVEKAADLAAWALSNEPGWSRDRIVDAMQGSESIDVKLRQHIQLVTVYVTAVVLENDEVHFFEDIYGRDGVPDEELAKTQRTVPLAKKPRDAHQASSTSH
jgi:murein L,D-transpeptidase YcbB/YkuD